MVLENLRGVSSESVSAPVRVPALYYRSSRRRDRSIRKSMIALIKFSVIPLARQAVRIGPEDRYLSEGKVLMGSGDLGG